MKGTWDSCSWLLYQNQANAVKLMVLESSVKLHAALVWWWIQHPGVQQSLIHWQFGVIKKLWHFIQGFLTPPPPITQNFCNDKPVARKNFVALTLTLHHPLLCYIIFEWPLLGLHKASLNLKHFQGDISNKLGKEFGLPSGHMTLDQRCTLVVFRSWRQQPNLNVEVTLI